MKNYLAETVNNISETFKKCCPSHVDAPFHINEWHEGDNNLDLRSVKESNRDYLTRTNQILE